MTREEAINEIKSWDFLKGKEIEAVRTLIPELNDRVDERMRRSLVDYFEHFNPENNWDDEFLFKDVLTYLEKQKDTNKTIEDVERIDKYIDEHLANAHDMKDSNPDKKYYRGWDDALGKMAGILQDVYSGEKQKEQSKEELVYRLNGLMQEYIKEGKDEAEKEHRLKCYRLFWDALEDTSYFEQKSDCLYGGLGVERCRWCSAACNARIYPHEIVKINVEPASTENQEDKEWSEEDESFLDSIEHAISSYYDLNHAPQYHYWLEEKLKSIRPQPKPECDNETEIQKAYREGKNAGRQEVFDNPGEYGLEKVDNVFGFRIGDRVRLIDGDGRPHIIKLFTKIEGLGRETYRVAFEDNTALDHIISGDEYLNGYFTNMRKIDNRKSKIPITEGKRLANEVIEYLTRRGYSPVLKDDSKKEHFHIDIPRHEDDFWHSEEYKHCRSVLGEYYMEGDYGGDTYTLYIWRTKKERKPAWSEDDKRMLKDTIRAIYLAYPYALDDENPRKNNIDWLKSLSERFIQSKKERSEEDDA